MEKKRPNLEQKTREEIVETWFFEGPVYDDKNKLLTAPIDALLLSEKLRETWLKAPMGTNEIPVVKLSPVQGPEHTGWKVETAIRYKPSLSFGQTQL
jgi:hypothetical protein